MSFSVERQQGTQKQTTAGYRTLPEAKADALAHCTSTEYEWVVFEDGTRREVGRALFSEGKAEWRDVP